MCLIFIRRRFNLKKKNEPQPVRRVARLLRECRKLFNGLMDFFLWFPEAVGSHLRCLGLSMGLSLRRCWMATVIAMFSCQVLRARGDAGRVMSCRPQWCMFARFSNYCCCRLIEDTLCLSGKWFGFEREDSID